ncbi:hypothetical protein HPB50_009793 [Hyalomma asiaticum]|uniref:Uncharacterized protein n=1 Tax=Hyalomma asiaticum TaxID=266040 RepID=A0ACB7S2H0_HYAAI|nr:hypothetical protein HPB50_009793 [Hyalomma asiaticum]
MSSGVQSSATIEVQANLVGDDANRCTPTHQYNTAANRRICCACALAAVGLVVGAPVIYFFVCTRPMATFRERPGFCCQVEAEAIVPLLNRSVDPCQDFYEYVCARSAESRQASGFFWSSTLGWKYTELLNRALLHSPAGRFRTRLLESYQRQVQHSWSVSRYVSAIVETGAVSVQMSPAKTARFLFEMSLKYSAAPPIFVQVTSVEPTASFLTLERRTDCFFSASQEEISAALNVFNRAFNLSLPAMALFDFDKRITEPHLPEQGNTESIAIERSPFSALSQKEWAELVREYILAVEPAAKTLFHAAEERLSALFDTLVKASNQPLAVAYATICTAVNVDTSVKSSVEESGFTQLGFACSALDVCELDEAFMADVVSSRDKDERVRNLFRSVRERILIEVSTLASYTAGAGSVPSLRSALRKVRLMLPKHIAVSDVAVPEIGPFTSFASGLFAARAYKFEVLRVKVKRRIPPLAAIAEHSVLVKDYKLFVPGGLYLLSTQLHSPDSAGPSLATLGFEMAAQLWRFVLELGGWSNASIGHLEFGPPCLENTFLFEGNDSNSVAPTMLVCIPLGLQTVIQMAKKSSWFLSYEVSSMPLSAAKMFYLTWAYKQCHLWKSRLRGLNVEAVLKSSPTFRRAFGCSESCTRSH